MDTIVINSENIKISDYHRLNLSDKISLKRSNTYASLSNLSIYYTWTNIKKSHTKTINLKYQLQNGVKSLNCLMDHVLYQIFKINLNIS